MLTSGLGASDVMSIELGSNLLDELKAIKDLMQILRNDIVPLFRLALKYLVTSRHCNVL